MKRVRPRSISLSDVFTFLKKNVFRLVWIVLSVAVFSFLAYRQITQSAQLTSFTVCVAKHEVKKGELVQKESVMEKTFTANSKIFSNAIASCKISQIYEIPVEKDIAQDDVLQISDFESEPSELKNQLIEQQTALYIPVKDIHNFPLNFQSGQTISLLAKDKKAPDSVFLLQHAKVIDLIKVKDDDDHELVQAFAVAVDEKQALSFTKAMSDGWTILVTVE